MLDSVCAHNPEWANTTSRWLALKPLLASWFVSPPLVIFPLILTIVLPWMIKRIPWRRQISSLGTVLLAIYLTVQLPLTINVAVKALLTFLPVNSGATADAIVILGRGQPLTKYRVETAAQLWQAHRAPLIFASGVVDAPQIIQLLGQEGIPRQALSGEDCSRTTEENARFTAMKLQPQGIKQILLVTDSPHMWRSLLTFRSFGFEVIPHTSPLPILAPPRKALIVLSEYVGLVSYSLQGRFLPRSLPGVKNAQIGQESST